jgi:hypothetical protein
MINLPLLTVILLFTQNRMVLYFGKMIGVSVIIGYVVLTRGLHHQAILKYLPTSVHLQHLEQMAQLLLGVKNLMIKTVGPEAGLQIKAIYQFTRLSVHLRRSKLMAQ